MSKMIVRTTCTATVGERLVLDVPDGADINTLSWDGAGGWSDAIADGSVTVMSRTTTQVYDERDRQVVLARVEEVPLGDAG